MSRALPKAMALVLVLLVVNPVCGGTEREVLEEEYQNLLYENKVLARELLSILSGCEICMDPEEMEYSIVPTVVSLAMKTKECCIDPETGEGVVRFKLKKVVCEYEAPEMALRIEDPTKLSDEDLAKQITLLMKERELLRRAIARANMGANRGVQYGYVRYKRYSHAWSICCEEGAIPVFGNIEISGDFPVCPSRFCRPYYSISVWMKRPNPEKIFCGRDP